MGQKYIIELEDNTLAYTAIIIEGTPYIKPLQLLPYTAPDLGQVRKKAYKIGYEKGYRDGVNRIGDAEDKIRKEAYDEGYDDAKGGYENGFENGMIVAWDAARKIIHMPEVDLLNLFTECYSAVCTPLQVFLKYDASECIEKIRQYEQEKEGQIQVGDEVIATSGKAVIVGINADKDKARYIYPDSTLGFDNICNLSKTGRHFPEIAAVLEKMRGEQDG